MIFEAEYKYEHLSLYFSSAFRIRNVVSHPRGTTLPPGASDKYRYSAALEAIIV